MSFSFTVSATQLPAFSVVLSEAKLPWQVEVRDALASLGEWPKPMLARISDGSNVAEVPTLSPESEALFARAGQAGSFLLYAPRKSSRGVEISRSATSVRFRLCALASVEDYGLAVRMAAATAKLAKVRVEAEHGPDGEAISPIAPEELLSIFGDAFAEKNSSQMGEGMLRAGYSPIYFYGPHGPVAIPTASAMAISPAERHATLVQWLRDGKAPAPPTGTSREQALLVAQAMFYAVQANPTPEKVDQVNAHLLTVPEFADRDEPFFAEASRRAKEITFATAAAFPLVYRKKAFTIACEVIACSTGGRLTGAKEDPDIAAVMHLAQALGMATEQKFLGQVVVGLAPKYTPGGAEMTEDVVRTMVATILMVAAAPGQISDTAQKVMSTLAHTVPEFRRRDFAALVEAAKARVALGIKVVGEDLAKLPKFRNKTFAVASEMALAEPKPAQDRALAMLDVLAPLINPSPDSYENLTALYALKYRAG